MKYKATHISKSPKVTDYSNYPPGLFLFMNFSFYNVVIIHGFTAVFDVICASTWYQFSFLTSSKRVPLDTLTWLLYILEKEDKDVCIVKVDEDGVLARSCKFFNLLQKCSISLQTTGG